MNSPVPSSNVDAISDLLRTFRDANWRNNPATDRHHWARIQAALGELPAPSSNHPSADWIPLAVETCRHLMPEANLDIAVYERTARDLLQRWSHVAQVNPEGCSWMRLVRYQTARELEHDGRGREAREIIEPLLQQTPATPGDLPEASTHTLAGLLALRFNENESARCHLEAAITFLDRDRFPAERSVALCYRGSLAFYEGKLKEARRFYEDALEAAQMAGDPDDIAYVQYFLAMILSRTQDLSQGLSHISEALPQIRLGKSHQMQSAALNLQGYFFHQMGAYDEAIACQREALQIVPDEGNPMARAACYLRIAEAQRAIGQYTEARRHAEKALALSRESGNRKEEASLHTLLGKLALDHDAPEVAEQHAVDACDLYDATRSLDYLPDALLILAEARWRQGRLEAAVETHQRFFALAEPDQAQRIDHLLALVRGLLEAHPELPEALFQLHEANGRSLFPEKAAALATAQGLIEEALRDARENQFRPREEEACKLLSRIHRTRGDLSTALDYLEAANAIHASLFAEKSDLRVKSLSIRFEAEEARRREEIARLRNVELAAANEALAALNEEKTHFLSIAAHDLKNPLGAIQQLALLGQDLIDRGESAPIQEFLKDIEGAASNMLRLVSNLLDLNRLEGGQVLEKIEKVDCAAVFSAVADRLQPSARAKGQTLQREFQTNSAIVLADAELLAQVLQNLLSNAIKYAPWQSLILLRLEALETGVRCSVVDRGPGISTEDQAKLFTRFTRLSARPTGDEHSSGLGLAIAKEFVDLMHGAIGCHSRLGEGATFHVTLPRPPRE
jgi:signal transduction histidine kinase